MQGHSSTNQGQRIKSLGGKKAFGIWDFELMTSQFKTAFKMTINDISTAVKIVINCNDGKR